MGRYDERPGRQGASGRSVGSSKNSSSRSWLRFALASFPTCLRWAVTRRLRRAFSAPLHPSSRSSSIRMARVPRRRWTGGISTARSAGTCKPSRPPNTAAIKCSSPRWPSRSRPVIPASRCLAGQGGPSSTAELEGARIAVSAVGAISELQLRVIMDCVGSDYDSLDLMAMPFADMAMALTNGTVDAASVVEPFVSQFLANGTATLLDHGLAQPDPNVRPTGDDHRPGCSTVVDEDTSRDRAGRRGRGAKRDQVRAGA